MGITGAPRLLLRRSTRLESRFRIRREKHSTVAGTYFAENEQNWRRRKENKNQIGFLSVNSFSLCGLKKLSWSRSSLMRIFRVFTRGGNWVTRWSNIVGNNLSSENGGSHHSVPWHSRGLGALHKQRVESLLHLVEVVVLFVRWMDRQREVC